MNVILNLVAKVIRHSAITGAGSASIRGTYESKVPTSLQKK